MAIQKQGDITVSGHNINNPCILTDKLSALESTTSSDIIWRNVEAMHNARKNFAQAESSEKIQRALCHRVRSYADVKYGDGEKVFYQRKNFKGWKEHGIVLKGQWKICSHQTGRGILTCTSVSANERKSFQSSYA